MEKITMRQIFNALCRELGRFEGCEVFAWYCKAYGVTIADNAPASIVREVLGL